MILATAPPGFDRDVTFDPAALGSIVAEHRDIVGRQFAIRDSSGEIHLWFLDGNAVRRPAVVVPHDGAHELRLDLAARFLSRLRGQRVGLLPPKLRLTDFQKHRYIQLLQAADLYDDGGEPRDVAAQILKSQQAKLPAIEFKDSAARKRADRLIKQALALVNHGYLQILRGD